MNNYIEFINEQNKWITGTTFENVSINDRILTFEIVTKDFFQYDGWYTYILYDELKTVELDRGKVYLNNPMEKKSFVQTTTTQKKSFIPKK